MAEQAGGAGGMDWVGLGRAIYSDSMNTINTAMAYKDQFLERRRKEKEDAEKKRQFNRTAKQDDRAQNLSALDYMSGKLNQARGMASQMSFRDAVNLAIGGR